MTGSDDFPEGGYRFIPGVAPYSAGVAALPGYEIRRAELPAPLPLPEGFRLIRDTLGKAGRPPASLCACELRSPEPFSEEGFAEFNREYIEVLEKWGIVRGGRNPVARSNVCPEIAPPPEPGILAFSYTVPGSRSGFVIAGCGEVPEGKPNYRDHIIRRGDLSAEGMAEKIRWVLGEQERRLGALGLGWAQVARAQVYTVHDVLPVATRELARRGVSPESVRPERCRPPVLDIEFEMDSRRVTEDLAL